MATTPAPLPVVAVAAPLPAVAVAATVLLPASLILATPEVVDVSVAYSFCGALRMAAAARAAETRIVAAPP